LVDRVAAAAAVILGKWGAVGGGRNLGSVVIQTHSFWRGTRTPFSNSFHWWQYRTCGVICGNPLYNAREAIEAGNNRTLPMLWI